MRAFSLQVALLASLFTASGFVACGGGSFTSSTSSGAGGGSVTSAGGGSTASAGGGSSVTTGQGGAGGATTSAGGGGAGGATTCSEPCPVTSPAASDVCECVGQECTYDAQCPAVPEITVRCGAEHTWIHTSTKPCCDDTICADDQVCLTKDEGSVTLAPQCATIQCNGTPDCECVSKLCDQNQVCVPSGDDFSFYCQGFQTD